MAKPKLNILNRATVQNPVTRIRSRAWIQARDWKKKARRSAAMAGNRDRWILSATTSHPNRQRWGRSGCRFLCSCSVSVSCWFRISNIAVELFQPNLFGGPVSTSRPHIRWPTGAHQQVSLATLFSQVTSWGACEWPLGALAIHLEFGSQLEPLGGGGCLDWCQGAMYHMPTS